MQVETFGVIWTISPFTKKWWQVFVRHSWKEGTQP